MKPKGFKPNYFSKIKIDSEYFELVGSKKRGADSVYDLRSVNNEDTEYIIKINTKQDNKSRFENEIVFLRGHSNQFLINLVSEGEIDYDEPDNFYLNGSYRYFVMPKMACDFEEKIKEGFSHAQGLKYFRQLCCAIKYLHDNKTIHRDLKPQNILYDSKNDSIKLCDFGIIKTPDCFLTQKGDRLANANYCAPEQRRKEGIVGYYTDIYSLGLILNEFFTKRLIDGTDYIKIVDVAPSYGELDSLVYEMTQNDITRRIKDIQVVIYRLDDFIRRKKTKETRYVRKVLGERKKLKERKIAKIFAEDCIALEYLFSIGEISNRLNNNYHMNIHCKIARQESKDELCLSSIHRIVSRKYSYESQGIKDVQDYKGWSVPPKELINQFENYIKPFKYLQNELYGETIHMFLGLRDYHAKEAIQLIKEDYNDLICRMDDAPICFLASLIADYYPRIKLINFGFIIEPIFELSSDELLEPCIFNSHSSTLLTLEESMRRDFHQTSIHFNKADSFLLFNSSKEHSLFKKICRDYIETLEEYDLVKVDIEDMLLNSHRIKSGIIIHLSDYDVKFLLPRIFNK